MRPRFYVDAALNEGNTLALPPSAARHLQVLRLQPGDSLIVFNGHGGEWQATVERMGRRDVDVVIGRHDSADRELPSRVALAFGAPANERMDTLVEKATELGAATIQPLLCERSVLRLVGDRAERKQAHWRGVAIAAAEQSGRTRVPIVEPMRSFGEWLKALPPRAVADERLLLALGADARPAAGLPQQWAASAPGNVIVLSGPEGGLSPDEEAAATTIAGFMPTSLGRRVLRADTAPLAALALLALCAEA